MRSKADGPADDEWAEPPIPREADKLERHSEVARHTGDHDTGNGKV